MISYATFDDFEAIANLARVNSQDDILAWVRHGEIRDAIKINEAIVFKVKNKLLGFTLFHLTKKGYITIYAICVEENSRQKGIGRQMMNHISQKASMQLKVSQKNQPANEFYQKIGGILVKTLKGKKRPLNLWRFEKGVV